MKKRINRWTFVLIMAMIATLFAGCGSNEPAVYTIHLSGAVEEAGVISYAGYEMNVYKDYASNSCGDCAEQPVSVYAGADAAEVADAISRAITRADDIWTVVEQTDDTVVLEEKVAGTAGKFDAPSAPAGLTITGELS